MRRLRPYVGRHLVRPDVLVVADEAAQRVGREGRLAGAREAEEDPGCMGAISGGLGLGVVLVCLA